MASLSRRPFWPAFLLGVLTIAAAGVLAGALLRPSAALAQIPDSGAQRNEMIRELQTSNRKLAEIADLLREIRDQGGRDRPETKGRPTTRP